MHIIKDSFSDSQVADSKLKFFNKAVSFHHISGQRNHLGCELHGCDKASQHEPSALIQKFLAEISYSFVDDLISEIKEALVVDNPILEAFNIFSMETQKNIEGNKCISFVITMEIKSTMFTKVIQLQQRPSYQCWNKKLDFNIFFLYFWWSCQKIKWSSKETSSTESS